MTRRCKFCGAAFSVLPSAISGRTNASGNFCSRRCYHKHLCRTERVNGRGSRWKAIRDEAIRRAPFCAICGTLRRLDVHHITPYRLSRDNSQANLIPLCKRHHTVVEGLYRDLAADHVVDRMCSAIKEFGFRIPVVARSDGTVVDGHLRLKAARQLGLSTVPVVLADELTDAQVKAFRLLANRYDAGCARNQPAARSASSPV